MLKKAGFEVIFKRSYGRVFRMSYWASRLQNYSSSGVRWLNKFLKNSGIENKLVYINTLDSIEVCARKL